MPTPNLSKAIFYAVCLGILLGCISEVSDRWDAAGGPRSDAPRLIAQDLTRSAQPLPSTVESKTSFPVHFDPQVHQASALMPELRISQALLGASSVDLAIAEIVQDAITWRIAGDGEVIRLANATMTVKGTGAKGGTVNVVFQGETTPAAVNTTTGEWSVQLTMTRADPQDLIAVTGTGNSATRRFVKLIAPTTDDAQLLEPLITAVSNNAYKTPTGLTEVRIYGGYLKMSGLRVQSGTQLKFAVFDNSGNKGKFLGLAIPSSPVTPRQDASWEAELDLTLPPEMAAGPTTKGFVRAIVFSPTGGLHRYSVGRVDFVVAPDSRKLEISGAPVIRNATDTNDLSKPGSDYLSKENRFFVSGNVAGNDSTLLQDSRIVILLNGAPADVRDIGIVTAERNKWSTLIKVDEDIRYTVEAKTVLGRDIFGAKSQASAVRVRAAGPSVVAVNPTNAALEGIRVTFNEAITVPNAGNLNQAFVLLDSKKTPKTAETTAALLPQLDPSDNSVTLTYKDVPPDVYTLTVKAGAISNLFGTAMAKDHTETLVRPIGAEEPAISRGITGPTGAYVPFPEYTKPRPIIDGFNPSDHVEARVSRLYYFRDAHRVAQIINRDVKSYNRAAVDTQQQLADKSRQIADQATDQRREKERKAVDAAKKTREAERELQEAEALAANAANQAANAAADQQRIDSALRNPATARTEQEQTALQAQADNVGNALTQLERVAESARSRAEAAYNKVQALREQESATNEDWQASIAVEDRAREEQFRREVAAANQDPDTYAPGQPGSEDPVRQVSVSVIGEGLIQLRGPIKGINVIRTMINQIDAPVGQVRVSVHTVQINGEKGERMEQVAGKIQRYIDHSRFLTLQSAEMLRKSIVTVAAQRAMELGECPGLSQEERDRKYLHSFFGEDFIRELEVMDSEFLKTGNKLLSIHSMDSTSLASALFIMALAKNATRLEILQTFDGMMGGDLQIAEQNYFEAGLTCDGKHRLFDKYCKRSDFQLLSGNARFQSIRGLFDAEIAADDTMTPIQREFCRLAQIFKSRLIVEMELKQRIMERAVIEERLGNRQKELDDARKLEEDAKRKLSDTQASRKNAQRNVLLATQKIQVLGASVQTKAAEAKKKADAAVRDMQGLLQGFLEFPGEAVIQKSLEEIGLTPDSLDADLRKRAAEGNKVYRTWQSQRVQKLERIQDKFLSPLQERGSVSQRLDEAITDIVKAKHPDIEAIPLTEPTVFTVPIGDNTVDLTWSSETRDKASEGVLNKGKLTTNPQGTIVLRDQLARFIAVGDEIQKTLALFEFTPANKQDFETATNILQGLPSVLKGEASADELLSGLHRAMTMFQHFSKLAGVASAKADSLLRQIGLVVAGIGTDGGAVNDAYKQWVSVEEEINRFISSKLKEDLQPSFEAASKGFQDLLAADLDYQFALREAEAARRPLDHKKFLDMLVDEMEDKYIELLEGTRAHTANIDAYIKRLITSLDDDLNTQFYYPTFRKVREASQLWDVQMGQVETTNVLANNRAFAKVTPEATMEFDLPKRDIVITEAIDGAKSMLDDVGALAQDPTFLAMAKLGSGQPTSSLVPGASGGLSTVRNVLPGLSTDTAEAVLGQQGPGGSQFGAALEGLIPDPAIYKFETGTGWEIRPVIQPDGQAVVFHFNYMYSTNIREPVRADEKHLGRVKRHFVDTDVQLSNFELREVSRYTVALKAARTSRGVPLLEDIPLAGVLFRPLPSDESSLQQNIILSQATIFPTLFDLMGLRWAPVVADLDPLRLSNDEFIVRGRRQALMNRVFDHSSSQVDEFLRIPEGERRMDLYRSQETIPSVHPNGYSGPGANLRDSQLQEGYAPTDRQPTYPVPGESAEGSPLRPQRPQILPPSNQLTPADGSEPIPPAGQGGDQVPESVPMPPADPPNARLNSAGSVRQAMFSEPTGGVVSHVSDLQPVHVSSSTNPSLPVRRPVVRLVPQANGSAASN